MPSGAGPDGRVVFSAVGRNPSDVAEGVALGAVVSTDGGVECCARKPGRSARSPTTRAPAMSTIAIHARVIVKRRGGESTLTGLVRRLLILVTQPIPRHSGMRLVPPVSFLAASDFTLMVTFLIFPVKVFSPFA